MSVRVRVRGEGEGRRPYMDASLIRRLAACIDDSDEPASDWSGADGEGCWDASGWAEGCPP